ncbi:trimeric LpxA-like protein [Hypoxylon fuscum]|nr:trimeric LpxA-like protein [Hypoxylon fuscum]
MSASESSGPQLSPFDPNEDQYRQARSNCARICAEYNALDERTSTLTRERKLLEIIPPRHTFGKSLTFAPKVQPPFHVDYGRDVSIHHTTIISSNCKIVDTPVASITIGRYCWIGPNVTISSMGPPLRPVDPNARASGIWDASGSSITIGDCVWIGASAVIGPGITIGENAKIMVGAVVLDDVPENALVAGNPAVVMMEETEE